MLPASSYNGTFSRKIENKVLWPDSSSKEFCFNEKETIWNVRLMPQARRSRGGDGLPKKMFPPTLPRICLIIYVEKSKNFCDDWNVLRVASIIKKNIRTNGLEERERFTGTGIF